MNFNLGDCTIRRYTSNLGRKFFIFGWMKGFVLLSALASLFEPFCFLVFGPRNYLQIPRNYLQSSRNYLKKHALY